MRKKCLIRQPAGLGDIIYCLYIAERIIEKYNCDIIWPVISQYKFISDYIQIDHLTFVDETENFPHKDIYTSNCRSIINNDSYMYIPLQFSDQILPNDLIMVSKYNLVGLNTDDWKRSLNFKRNSIKEDELYYKTLKLHDDTKFIFVNSLYASPPDTRHIDNINISDNSQHVVDLQYITGYNPFDWCKVMERADEIHSVDTCYTFLLEFLNLSASNINIYSRVRAPDSPTFSETKWLFSDKFSWVHN